MLRGGLICRLTMWRGRIMMPFCCCCLIRGRWRCCRGWARSCCRCIIRRLLMCRGKMNNYTPNIRFHAASTNSSSHLRSKAKSTNKNPPRTETSAFHSTSGPLPSQSPLIPISLVSVILCPISYPKQKSPKTSDSPCTPRKIHLWCMMLRKIWHLFSGWNWLQN